MSRHAVRCLVGAVLAAIAAPSVAGEAKEFFAAFLEKPGKETYLAVFKAVTEAESYDPYSMDLNGAWGLIKEKKFKEAQEKLEKAMPSLLLSPRAHGMAAMAAEGLNDAAKAKSEREAAAKCIQGMLATGDGSADKPYLVTRVTDEYDVLRHLKKAKTTQGLRNKDGKSFDVMSCEDGTEVWFDITVVFGSLSKKLKGKGEK
ncbi:MAG TPA: DUF4919 domain-containing protein [Planctomycetota bacterium]|nr:DUF4919 domain-containing protein [Planctomycetota bacterium]